jgi:hypothetical protein
MEAPQFRSQRSDAASSTQPAWERSQAAVGHPDPRPHRAPHPRASPCLERATGGRHRGRHPCAISANLLSRCGRSRSRYPSGQHGAGLACGWYRGHESGEGMGGSPRPLGGADAAQRVRSFGYACSAVVRKKEPQCVDHFDSLLRFRNSLFVRIVSLLVCVGNCRRSACSTEVSCSETDPHRPKTAKFPVKFPVTRETAWRQVRSALRRQGGSLVRTATFRLTERLSLGRSAVQPLCGTVIEPKGTSGPPVWRAVRRDPV